MDQSGNFGGDLIAVTGADSFTGGGVWRINSTGSASRVGDIPFTHLEGVITLTNDVQKWGPWAGKIITGAEAKTPPLIYTVSTNGIITSYDDLGIAPEDFEIIPANQDLYCVDQSNNQILKLSKTLLVNYVGDLLITQEGASFGKPKLFIVHWDGTNFVKRGIAGSDEFEHITFAPINIPNL